MSINLGVLQHLTMTLTACGDTVLVRKSCECFVYQPRGWCSILWVARGANLICTMWFLIELFAVTFLSLYSVSNFFFQAKLEKPQKHPRQLNLHQLKDKRLLLEPKLLRSPLPLPKVTWQVTRRTPQGQVQRLGLLCQTNISLPLQWEPRPCLQHLRVRYRVVACTVAHLPPPLSTKASFFPPHPPAFGLVQFPSGLYFARTLLTNLKKRVCEQKSSLFKEGSTK